ncbi:hypothetical protein [Selenomonas ruminantium]|uniref:Zinc finger domain-containing protein, LSD1 subclass n=1 Tax=Selenomonas ruminantium TaxID=971 RepID=A0A1H0QCK4_SELRU|nr:hypothetical protein [Selenomonas ruminantium]SDP15102.1 zinc finger domain-containing protein, LSD1 subclass [Selenomonas ruminantium]
MADTSVAYKCPNCSAPLEFQPGTQKIKCEHCDTELEAAAIEELYRAKELMAAQAADNEDIKWNKANAEKWSPEEVASMKTFVCESCGAEIIADGNTMATECCYCGHAVMIPQRFSGSLRPDYIIPFKTTKDEAMKAISEFYKGLWLLPRGFMSNNRIESVQALYVPFWLFDSFVNTLANFRAKIIRVYTDGDEAVTETSHYECLRQGNMSFAKIPVDGSEKMNNDYMESIEPFDYADMVPFTSCYKNKIYTFMMNGQTGKVAGDLPVSWIKTFQFFSFTFGVFWGLLYYIIKISWPYVGEYVLMCIPIILSIVL